MGILRDDHQATSESLRPSGAPNVGDAQIAKLHRDLLLRDLVRGRDILCLTLGADEASAAIGIAARSVTTIDLGRTLSASQRSAMVALSEGSVDCVVALDILPSLADPEGLIDEVARVLRADGFCVVGSARGLRPIEMAAARRIEAPAKERLDELLAARFPVARRLAQYPIVGSLISLEAEGRNAGLANLARGVDGADQAAWHGVHPSYIFILAARTALPALADNVYVMGTDPDQIAPVGDPVRRTPAPQPQRPSDSDQRLLQADRRQALEHAIGVGRAQAGEIGMLLHRVATEEAKVASLQAKLATMAEELDRATAGSPGHGGQTAAGTARWAARDGAASDLPSAVASPRRSIDPDVALEAELAQLRTQVAAQIDPAEIMQLRRMQIEVMASLKRPPAVMPFRDDLPEEQRGNYDVLYRSLLMDREWYLATYPDVVAAGFDPVTHYLLEGYREGRRPSVAFDGDAYLLANPDVALGGTNPLLHYLLYGAKEQRPVMPERSLTPAADYVDGDDRGDARTWFFVGDTLEWMAHHRHFTGVGRVTSELLLAAIARAETPMSLCVRGASVSGLRGVTDLDFIDKIVRRAGRPAEDAAELKRGIRTIGRAMPVAGDTVLFTGVVWTEQYAILFRQLAASGVYFGVLLHDIIPIVRPEIVEANAVRSFGAWLNLMMQTASVVFVSNHLVQQDVRRWLLAARLPREPRIDVIRFGNGTLPPASSSTVLDLVDADFVLSVGTIDVRKNQALLVALWDGLLARIGASDLPQLVLVGRDDIALHAQPDAARLSAAGKLMLLEGLGDEDLGVLYDSCRFTAFASKSEGYGLPVAESLACGKLCLSSDLAAIRDHAGEFAWYFDPEDREGALALFETAIRDASAVRAAEAGIAEHYRRATWGGTVVEMLSAVESQDGSLRSPRHVAGRYAGVVDAPPGDVLQRAAAWCSSTDPRVSILIVNWNAASLTLDCIRQIWAKTDRYRYEIVIVDNGSSEADLLALRDLGDGIRLIELGCNRYYGEANNIAAEAARGEFLCLLNNDAFVHEGWLDALIDPILLDDTVGATGPLFLFPDGRVQEAGAIINQKGIPVRFGRDEPQLTPAVLTSRIVDYISAATLVMRRALFLDIGGFDLQFEPAYYEDTDLCFKIAGFGRSVLYCPAAKVTHIEGSAANGDAAAEQHRKHLGDLNRAKFMARWGGYIADRRPETLAPMAASLTAKSRKRAVRHVPKPDLPSAVLYTPYGLTPGGGERYLLTAAASLTHTHNVTLTTAHPYSRLRLRSLGEELGIDTSRITLASEGTPEDPTHPDVHIVMGNRVVPPVAARGRISLFHCQFPFPGDSIAAKDAKALIGGYDSIVVNSGYTALHVEAALNARQLPEKAIRIVPPPVKQFAALPKVPGRILSVGRIFLDGHSKRHDQLIEAFHNLPSKKDGGLELHIAGSSTPEARHMAYLSDLIRMGGKTVRFHLNASAEKLAELYGSAEIYWHGTGIGGQLDSRPYAAEHFGISIVEAMSAGVVPFALASGGPREIIRHGVDGFLYDSVEALVDLTVEFLAMPAADRARIAEHAKMRAEEFTVDKFAARLGLVLAEEWSDGAAAARPDDVVADDDRVASGV